MFSNLETHLAKFLQSADTSLHAGAQAFKSFFESEEARLAQIVAEAKAAGLKVVDASGKEL